MIRDVRLLTWNVNGLRACVQRLKKKNLAELLDSLNADILCFQETKTTRSELDEELVRPPGYDAFYSFCRVRAGYSGVVTYCRTGTVPTVAAEEGLTGMWPVDDAIGHVGTKHHELSPRLLNELESEGRCVITDHQAFVLINLYCPAVRNLDRLDYKLAFHELLEDRVKALQKAGRRVIVVGDINISHREIDHCDPGPRDDGSPFSDHPCRLWMDRFVISSLPQAATDGSSSDDTRLVDSFRHFHPTEAKAYTCWNMVTASRQTNYGTRIDYILSDRELFEESVRSCSILPDQMGSDHCPVACNLVVQFDESKGVEPKTASLCARFYTEFAGKQQSLKSFFVQRGDGDHSHTTDAVPENAFAIGQSPRPSSTFKLSNRSKPSTGSANQRSIKQFFSQPPSNRTTLHPGRENNPEKTIVSATDSTGIDQDVWDSFLGSKRRLVEEEQSKWKQVLSGRAPKTPLCRCGEPTVLRTVLKTNENWGRKFYVCTRPEGEKGHPDARCEFFEWVDQKGTKKPKR